MAGTIVNLSNRPVSIRLNTGQTRHIPPRAPLTGILAVEVKDNAMVRKLRDRHVIALEGLAVGPQSIEMKADEAIAYIRNHPLSELTEFVPDEEDRTTVRRAWQEKQDA